MIANQAFRAAFACAFDGFVIVIALFTDDGIKPAATARNSVSAEMVKLNHWAHFLAFAIAFSNCCFAFKMNIFV